MARGSAAGAPVIPIPIPIAILIAIAITITGVLIQPGCVRERVDDEAGAGASRVVEGDGSAGSPADLEAQFRPLIEAHNARVAKLEAIEGNGVVEVWFLDGGERRREQLDVDLLLGSGGRGSLRLKKLSSDFAAIGGDGKRSWIFDLRTKPARATVYDALPAEVETGAARALASGEIDALSPASLRFMMGVTPIPADARIDVRIAARADTRADASASAAADRPTEIGDGLRARYCATWTRSSVVARLSFGADGLPDEIVLEDTAGSVIAISRLSAYEPARVEGLSQLAWPMVATRFRAEAPRSRVEAQFKLEPAKLEAQSRRGKARMFDLDALISFFRPESVEYILRQDDGTVPDVKPDVKPEVKPDVKPEMKPELRAEERATP